MGILRTFDRRREPRKPFNLPLMVWGVDTQESLDKLAMNLLLALEVDAFAESLALVRAAGFACACSVYAGLSCYWTDLFQLPRYGMYDMDGEDLSRRLAEWFLLL